MEKLEGETNGRAQNVETKGRELTGKEGTAFLWGPDTGILVSPELLGQTVNSLPPHSSLVSRSLVSLSLSGLSHFSLSRFFSGLFQKGV